MANTRGFEVVAQVTVGVLRTILRDAWKNGGDASGAGTLPQKQSIPAGLAFGPYRVKDGEIVLPEAGLGLDMAPSVNGVSVKLGLIVSVEIENPPIPSASLFNMTADLTIAAPVAVVEPATQKVGLRLSGLPAGAVTAAITSGDPVGPITAAAVAEYVHARYRDPAGGFPKRIEAVPISFAPFSMKADLDIFDDESDPARRITVIGPAGGEVSLRMPCRIRFYEIEGSFMGVTLHSPMAVDAAILMRCAYVTETGKVIARLSTGTATLEDIAPAAGTEGANYSTNAAMVGAYLGDPDALANLIRTNFQPRAEAQLRLMGDIEVPVPTVAQIEAFIVAEVRKELEARRHIAIWQPEAPEGSDVTIHDVTPRALADTLAIAINAGAGANAALLTRLIPAGKDFCVAISAGEVNRAIAKARDSEFPNGLPHRYRNIEGYDADLEKLDIRLRDDDHILMEGDVTVIDAILDKIDVGASFSAKVDLRWEDAPEGGQRIVPFLKEEPDVSMSVWAWIVSIIIGFILLGLIGAIIVAVVMAVVQGIASRIGGAVIRDELTGQLRGVGAWPQTLDGIGTIAARFDPPVDIDTGGILSSGSMLITATHALTAVDQANARGPYTGKGGQVVALDGGPDLAVTAPRWLFGDGALADLRRPTHVYGRSGTYVAKLRLAVAEAGGATTRNFAMVRLENVPPRVTLPADILLDEGEAFEIVAQFEDQEWLDTHEAVIDFGDNSRPKRAVVAQTNSPPAARGTARASHAYCNNGRYTITVRVIDSAGGVGVATMTAHVRNVAPSVILPDRLATLVGQPVRLIGRFTDPGWCDRHTGHWEFGDCAAQAAIIRQRHAPPAGEGTAEAVHVYRHCGVHEARLTVTDEDGDSAAATMRVDAVEVRNPGFEDGFHRRDAGDGRSVDVLANGWTPVRAPFPAFDAKLDAAPRSARFLAEAREAGLGQRAQRIEITGAMLAAIAQRLRANPGWCYELEARFELPLPSPGSAMIGICSRGGSDPLAPSVTWSMHPAGDDWRWAAVRARAEADHVTLFLGLAQQALGGAAIGWDRVDLRQIQPWCEDAPCIPRPLDLGKAEGPLIEKAAVIDGARFEAVGEPIRILRSAEGRTTLCQVGGAMRIVLPGPVDALDLDLFLVAPVSVEIKLYDAGGLVRQVMEALPAGERRLTIREPGLAALELRADGRGLCLAGVTGCLPEAPPPERRRLCLDLGALPPGRERDEPFDLQGFRLSPPPKEPVRVVGWGPPDPALKLALPRSGLKIDLPFAADRIEIALALFGGPVRLAVWGADGLLVEAQESRQQIPVTVTLERPGIGTLVIEGGGGEALLLGLCIEAGAEPRDRPVRKPPLNQLVTDRAAALAPLLRETRRG